MKKTMSALALGACLALTGRVEAAPVGLEQAIGDFCAYVQNRIQRDALTAVLGIDAPVKDIAVYINDTLVEKLLNDAKARLVSRQNLEIIKLEQKIQADGSVDDATDVSLGNIAGWQTVITGAVSAGNDIYRLSL